MRTQLLIIKAIDYQLCRMLQPLALTEAYLQNTETIKHNAYDDSTAVILQLSL